MHQDIKQLAADKLVSSRRKAFEQPENGVERRTPPPVPKRPARPEEPHYNTIPTFPQESPYNNIPQFAQSSNAPRPGEKLEFEQKNLNDPAGPKQRRTFELPERWTAKGTFVANTSEGLLFKMRDADANDGLVKFSPDQSKSLLASDKHGLITKSLTNGGEAGLMTVSSFKDGAVTDMRVTQRQADVPQPRRGIHK